MGIRFPEFDEWQEEAKTDAQEEREKMRAIEKLAFEAGGDLSILVQKLQADLAQQQAKREGSC